MKKILFCLFVICITLNGNSQNAAINTATTDQSCEIKASFFNVITPSGNLMVGAQNTMWCHMYSDRPAFIFNKPVFAMNGQFSSYYNTDLQLQTGNYSFPATTRMTILNSNGFVGINNVIPSYQLDVVGQIRATNVTVTSDERLKTNIKDMSGALSTLVNLKGKTYNLISPTSTNPQTLNIISAAKTDTGRVQTAVIKTENPLYNRIHRGFLAQDLQKTFPDLVYADKDGILSVDYISLIPVLVESIKEQQLVISDLQAAVATLKKKNNIQ